MNLVRLVFTLLAGGITGGLFVLLKIPSGLRIGAMLGSALLSVLWGAAYMPSITKLLVQVIAGALIGCTMERGDLRRLPQVVKPTLIMLFTFLALNIGAGFLIFRLSPLDLITSLMCVIPGGVTDTPIIAADMGADTPKVAVVQLGRYLLGVGAFPPMILAYDALCVRIEKKRGKSPRDGASETAGEKAKREKSSETSPWALLCTLGAALAAGAAGQGTGIPAGAFLFSIIAVLALKLKFDFAYLHPRVKKCALLVSGCYIGSAITMNDVRGFKTLALPLGITLGGYIINCFATGKILRALCGFSRKEGMLITTPAGASDIALSSADIGVGNTDIIVIQVFRAVIAMAVFPQIINLVVVVFG
jgi:membrane AbrB-like protein